jgi:hypothetical protein
MSTPSAWSVPEWLSIIVTEQRMIVKQRACDMKKPIAIVVLMK